MAENIKQYILLLVASLLALWNGTARADWTRTQVTSITCTEGQTDQACCNASSGKTWSLMKAECIQGAEPIGICSG